MSRVEWFAHSLAQQKPSATAVIGGIWELRVALYDQIFVTSAKTDRESIIEANPMQVAKCIMMLLIDNLSEPCNVLVGIQLQREMN